MALADIGHGVRAELVYYDGEPRGVDYWHECDGTQRVGWIPLKPWSHLGWDLVQADPLTVSPSALCRRCGHHGFIRGGVWVPA